MNKQELIGKIKSAETLYLSFTPFIEKKLILDLVKQLDEPQKPVVKQFVADFITEQKKLGHTLSYSIDACMELQNGIGTIPNISLKRGFLATQTKKKSIG